MPTGRVVWFGTFAVFLVSAAVAVEPQSGDVADLFRHERAAAERSGAADVLSAYPLRRADDWARRGDAALRAGQADDAARLFRAARWALPFVPLDAPNRIARILGDPRLRNPSAVSSVAFSRDGELLASVWSRRSVDGSAGGGIRVWDMATGRLVQDYRSQGDRPRAAVFLDNARLAAAGGKEIRVWDATTGRDERVFTAASDQVSSLAVEPGSRRLAAGENRAVSIWDVAAGKSTFTLAVQGASQRITAVDWSRDGRLVAAVTDDGSLAVWDVSGPEPKRLLEQRYFSGSANGVRFAPGGQTVAVCGERSAKLVGLPGVGSSPAEAAGPVRRTLEGPGGHTDQVTAVAFSPDGRTLATAGRDNVVRVWNPASGQVQRILPGHNEEVAALDFDPSGQRLASGGQDQAVRLWDFEPIRPTATLRGHVGPVWAVTFTERGEAVSGGADRVVRLWSVSSGKELQSLTGHRQPVTAIALADGRSTVLTASGDGTVRSWPLAGGEPRTVLTAPSAILALAASSDASSLITGGADRIARLWDRSGQQTTAGPPHAAAVTAVARAPAGDQAASASADGTVKLWSLEDGRERTSFRAHESGGTAAAVFTPDGRRLVTAGGDRLVKVWRVAPGFSKEPVAVLGGHGGPVTSVAVSPDGQFAASGGADAVVKVWDLANRAEVQSFRGHTDWVASVAFAADGAAVISADVSGAVLVWNLDNTNDARVSGHARTVTAVAAAPGLIVTGSGDRGVFCWDEASGLPRRVLGGHGGEITALFVSTDGTRLLSGGEDRRLRLWDLTNGTELQAYESTDRERAPAVLILPGKNQFLAWQIRDTADDESVSAIRRFSVHGGVVEDVLVEKGKAARCLAFSADGRLAAAGLADGTARVWDLETKKKVTDDFSAHSKPVADIALTPDKKLLVSVSVEGEVKIWQVSSATTSPVATGKTGWPVAGIAMAPSGGQFAAYGLEGEVGVFETATGKRVCDWALRQRVGAMSFTGNSRYLVTGNADGTAYVLKLPE